MSRPVDAAAALLRAVVRGTGAASELDEADRLLRTALPLTRRVGCVAVAGGSGTSTTAAALANVLAARRAGMVLAGRGRDDGRSRGSRRRPCGR